MAGLANLRHWGGGDWRKEEEGRKTKTMINIAEFERMKTHEHKLNEDSPC